MIENILPKQANLLQAHLVIILVIDSCLICFYYSYNRFGGVDILASGMDNVSLAPILDKKYATLLACRKLWWINGFPNFFISDLQSLTSVE